jgi:hypothetical protein
MGSLRGYDILMTFKHLLKRRVATIRPRFAGGLDNAGSRSPGNALALLSTQQAGSIHSTRWAGESPPRHELSLEQESLFTPLRYQSSGVSL